MQTHLALACSSALAFVPNTRRTRSGIDGVKFLRLPLNLFTDLGVADPELQEGLRVTCKITQKNFPN